MKYTYYYLVGFTIHLRIKLRDKKETEPQKRNLLFPSFTLQLINQLKTRYQSKNFYKQSQI